MRFFVILFCLLFANPAAGMQLFAGRPAASGGGSYDDILFFWTCESSTLGADDYYGSGDNTATLISTAAINTDAVKVGTNGLDFPDANDRITFDISAASDFIDGTEGRIGFWFYYTTQVDYATLMSIDIDASNFLEMYPYNGGITVRWREGGTNAFIEISSADISTTTWYFLEFGWNASSNTRTVYLDGVQKAQSTASFTGLDFSSQTLNIGIDGGYAGDQYIDNFMISDDSTRDFCGLNTTCVGIADDTTSPR